MAPELKSKRAAAVAGGASKKFKPNHPLAAKFEVIQNALSKTKDLPDSIQGMLIDLLPCSLGESRDKRHAFQTEIVSAIGEMLNKSAQALERDISVVQAQLEDANAKEALQSRDYWKEHEKLEEKECEVKKCKQELATVALAFRAAKARLQEAKDKQKREDANLETMSKKKHKLEAAVEDLIPPLSMGSAEGQDATSMADQLINLLRDFEFEESLITALSYTLQKTPAKRGEFDTMCFQELNETILKRIADFQTNLSNGEAAKEERAVAVAAAEQSFNKASAEQFESARVYTVANAASEEINAAANVANNALKDLGQRIKSCNSSLSKAKAKLESFNNGPVAAFKELEEHDNNTMEPMKVELLDAE